jgi:hypothetical protein
MRHLKAILTFAAGVSIIAHPQQDSRTPKLVLRHAMGRTKSFTGLKKRLLTDSRWAWTKFNLPQAARKWWFLRAHFRSAVVKMNPSDYLGAPDVFISYAHTDAAIYVNRLAARGCATYK